MTNRQESGFSEFLKATRKEAEQGDAEAQNRLGWMYCEGIGVPENNEESGQVVSQSGRAG